MSPVDLMRGQGRLADRMLAEAARVRTEIREGQFQRVMAVMAAFAAIVSGFEAYVQHSRGAFSRRLMWTPVWLTPPTVLAAAGALFSERVARTLLPAVSLVSLLDGVVGFAYHLRGIQRLPGGFKLGQYNVVMGPPIFAPLLTCSVGAIGLIAGFLRRERIDEPWWHRMGAESLATAAHPAKPSSPLQRFLEDVSEGRFQRVMALIAAALAILSGGEAYFEHLRGSFNQRWMWTPVWATPPMVLAAAGAAASERMARTVLPVASIVTFLDGLLGFALHLRGIKRMPGGFANLQFNLTLGPPMFAPLLFSATGILGLVASLLRRRRNA
jgi:hypothetical protein